MRTCLLSLAVILISCAAAAQDTREDGLRAFVAGDYARAATTKPVSIRLGARGAAYLPVRHTVLKTASGRVVLTDRATQRTAHRKPMANCFAARDAAIVIAIDPGETALAQLLEPLGPEPLRASHPALLHALAQLLQPFDADLPAGLIDAGCHGRCGARQAEGQQNGRPNHFLHVSSVMPAS